MITEILTSLRMEANDKMKTRSGMIFLFVNLIAMQYLCKSVFFRRVFGEKRSRGKAISEEGIMFFSLCHYFST